jgi:hypothetical protein
MPKPEPEYITFKEAAKLPPGGVCERTIHRWSRGKRGHCLFSVLIAGTRFTTPEAVAEFLAATAAPTGISEEAAAK